MSGGKWKEERQNITSYLVVVTLSNLLNTISTFVPKNKEGVILSNNVAIIGRMLFLSGMVFAIVPQVMRLYSLSYETASIYIWTVSVGIASVAGAIRMERRMELLWGLCFVSLGLIVGHYTSYHDWFLACVKIGPLVAYCLWVIYRLERCETRQNNRNKTQLSLQQESEQGQNLSRNKQLFATFVLITIVVWVVAFFICSLFIEKTPKSERMEAIFWTLRLIVIFVLLNIGNALLAHIAKKVYDSAIWIYVIAGISLGVIPGIVGFGWVYALMVGSLWGATAYFGGKVEQDKWNDRRNRGEM